MTPSQLVQAAIAGPVVAGVAWLALVRWPLGRRWAAGAVAVAAHAAAWAVLWLAYRGDPVAWRGFGPELLGATVAVAAELGILLAAVRADRLDPGAATPAVAGLAASASAVVVAGYADALVVQALFLTVPTLAAAFGGLSAPERGDISGFLGLAAADAAALAGLSVAYARGGPAVGPEAGLGAGLLLAAAAVKAGAVPWFGTARLLSGAPPGAMIAAGPRGQGLALAAVAGLVMLRGDPAPALAVAAGAAILLSGIAALVARTPAAGLAGATAAAGGMPFLALGLGGAVGVRAFLVLAPALLVAAGAAALVTPVAPPPGRRRARRGRGAAAREAEAPRAARWMATVTAGVAVGSLLGVPVGAGFPGTWLALALAGDRADPSAVVAAALAALGLVVALMSSLALVRAARADHPSGVLGLLASIALLYIGTQPVRLGLGWWLRVEAEVGVAEILPSAGAPALPPVGGQRLLLVAAPALVAVVLLLALGRGLRDTTVAFDPPLLAAPPAARAPVRVLGPDTRFGRVLDRSREAGVGLGVAMILEAAAVTMALRLMFVAAYTGFL